MTKTTKITRCSKCKERIFTSEDSFLPDPFSTPDAKNNVPSMDMYFDGQHLCGCDNSLAKKIPQIIFNLKSSMVQGGMTDKEADAELSRRKKIWLGN